jgi:hypothetical protein
VKKRIILGAGQCGMKLAHLYFKTFQKKDSELIALSTSTEDSVGIPKANLIQVATEGSGKKFSNGSLIWENNFSTLLKGIENIKESDIIYFASAGGGSGSSSIKYVIDILMEASKNNRVFLVMVLPFKYEQLPFKPNALQSINALQILGYSSRISIMLFNNDYLSTLYADIKKDGSSSINLEKINEHIISSVSLVLDLISEYHDQKKFSPFTIDELEHESVVFSNGFIGVESIMFEGEVEAIDVKFEYGKLGDAKNIIIAKAVDPRESDYIVNQSIGSFIEKVETVSNKARKARVMYGIIRTDKIENGTYVIIANNLDVTKYMDKIKNKIKSNVKDFLKEDSADKILSNREQHIFDI